MGDDVLLPVKNWEDLYKELGYISACRTLIWSFNHDITLVAKHPNPECTFETLVATFRNPETSVLHWCVCILLPDGLRVSRGIGVYQDDSDDMITEDNYSRSLESPIFSVEPTDDELKEEAWQVIANFLEASGA